MIIQEKIENDYIIRANLHKITADHLKIAGTLDALDDTLADVRVDVSDLIHEAGNGGYSRDLIDTLHQLRAVISSFTKARASYRRALQEYIAEH